MNTADRLSPMAQSSLEGPRKHSIEAFCLRMLHKKYFNVSNRWYAPDLNKQNGDSCDKFFGNGSSLFLFSVCNLSVSVRKSAKWFFGVL